MTLSCGSEKSFVIFETSSKTVQHAVLGCIAYYRAKVIGGTPPVCLAATHHTGVFIIGKITVIVRACQQPKSEHKSGQKSEHKSVTPIDFALFRGVLV